MPFVLKNRQTSEIYACMLMNHYNIGYYGAKYWEDGEEAGREYASFLLSEGTDIIGEWEVVEVEEEQLKLFNVKLGNNATRKLYLGGDGKAVVRMTEAE